MAKTIKFKKRQRERFANFIQEQYARRAKEKALLVDKNEEPIEAPIPAPSSTRNTRRIIKSETERLRQGKNDNGYWLTKTGKLEHREVYKDVYGRIPGGWVVHHIDQCKTNNAPENLMAMPRALHDRLHAHMRNTGIKFNRTETEAYCRPEINQREKHRRELEKALVEEKKIKAKIAALRKLVGDDP
jgi:hypothetical protein